MESVESQSKKSPVDIDSRIADNLARIKLKRLEEQIHKLSYEQSKDLSPLSRDQSSSSAVFTNESSDGDGGGSDDLLSIRSRLSSRIDDLANQERLLLSRDQDDVDDDDNELFKRLQKASEERKLLIDRLSRFQATLHDQQRHRGSTLPPLTDRTRGDMPSAASWGGARSDSLPVSMGSVKAMADEFRAMRRSESQPTRDAVALHGRTRALVQQDRHAHRYYSADDVREEVDSNPEDTAAEPGPSSEKMFEFLVTHQKAQLQQLQLLQQLADTAAAAVDSRVRQQLGHESVGLYNSDGALSHGYSRQNVTTESYTKLPQIAATGRPARLVHRHSDLTSFGQSSTSPYRHVSPSVRTSATSINTGSFNYTQLNPIHLGSSPLERPFGSHENGTSVTSLEGSVYPSSSDSVYHHTIYLKQNHD